MKKNSIAPKPAQPVVRVTQGTQVANISEGMHCMPSGISASAGVSASYVV